MTMPEVVEFIRRYARHINAPVRERTTVTSVHASDGGYRVVTNRGEWRCRAVVIASGAHNLANVPAVASALPPSVRSLTPKDYRNPEQLESSGVLIVGASATGVQLADEIQRSGRHGHGSPSASTFACRACIAAGTSNGGWTPPASSMSGTTRSTTSCARGACRRRNSSVRPQRLTLDLNALTERGVEVVGRVAGISDGQGAVLRFAAQSMRDGGSETCAAARDRSTPGWSAMTWRAK